MKKIKIALLSGGNSNEREVSLKTGEKIFQALNKDKYEIFRYDLKNDLDKFIKDTSNRKFDLVFPALHGNFGEDGSLQGMLDFLRIPYVFSGCLASALAMDKFKTKRLVENFGIKVAKDYLIKKNQDYDIDRILIYLKFPMVVKPVSSGSSIGVTMAKNKKELETGIQEAFQYGGVLLEEFIEGRELTAAVFGNGGDVKVLPIIEIKPKISKWFDYKAKYQIGGSEEICPASISDEIKIKIEKDSLKVFEILDCEDLVRLDFILNKENEKVYFLEVNTIPGMTETSLVPKSAQASGLDFPNFLDKLIEIAIKKSN